MPAFLKPAACLAAVVVLSACATSEQRHADRAASETAVEMDAAEIETALNGDADGFADDHLNVVLRVTGFVADVDPLGGYDVDVMVAGSPGAAAVVKCELVPGAHLRSEDYSTGDEVTVKGVFADSTLAGLVWLSGCSFD